MADAGSAAVLRQTPAVSLPLDLVCVLSLLHRAVPESHFDPWLTETRARLPTAVRDNLDLLHGFSGRQLYYPEEPAMRFRPLEPDRADASFETFIAFLLTLPPAEYLGMVESALRRTHHDLGLAFAPIDPGDRERLVERQHVVLHQSRVGRRRADGQAAVASPVASSVTSVFIPCQLCGETEITRV